MLYTILNRREAESGGLWAAETAVISVTDPSVRGVSENRASIRVDSNVVGFLRLQFHDLDPESDPRLRAPGAELAWAHEGHAGPQWMAPEQAGAVCDFWRAMRPLAQRMVVHCEAGISRSAGIVAAFCVMEGVDDAWVYRAHVPNAHVKSSILRAWATK